MIKIELELEDKRYEDLIAEMDKYNIEFNGKFTDVTEYIKFLLNLF